ncbi:MAG: choice-of-anchor B family protein [Bacteroidota bacterium]
MQQFSLSALIFLLFSISAYAQPCVLGNVSSNGIFYPCDEFDLQSHLDLNDLRATGDGNDIWGWTDPMTGDEYALMGLNNGTAFVDISDPQNPVLLGNLGTHSGNSQWRDIKVVSNYAYIVSEAFDHGMQVFDLTRLRNVSNPPQDFTEDGHIDFGNSRTAHNIVANPETNFVYLVGTNNYSSGGITAVDVSNPTSPQIVANYGDDGYTHDAQCVTYRGPDTEYIGQEICIGLNENEVVVIDYTDKDDPTQISAESYPTRRYVHQGWLTDDHRYLLVNDESDESFINNTRTYIFDLIDLDNPVYLGVHTHTTRAIDHNLYVKGNYVYLANYRAGLRAMKLDDIANSNLNEVAFFDLYPSSDAGSFNGAWSSYPYFKSGNIIVSAIEDGLFVVKPTFPHFVLSNDGASVINLSPGQSRQVSIGYNEYGGFNENVSLSIESVPSDLQITLSTSSISADGTINIQVAANASAATAKYHIVLKGESTSGVEVERLAFGVIVGGSQPACPGDLTVANDPISIPNGTYQASTTLSSAGNIQNGSAVTFKAGQSITLLAGFVAQAGSVFSAVIEDCSTNITNPPTIKDRIDHLTSDVVASPETLTTWLTPNPARDRSMLSVQVEIDLELSIDIFDLSGRKIKVVRSNQRIAIGTHVFELPIGDLKAGVYLVDMRLDDQRWSEKLVVLGEQ